MILDRIKSTIKERKLKEELLIDQKEIELSSFEMDIFNPTQDRIQTALQQLSESCRKLMILFYYRQYSIEAIMHSMGYLNENVTKSHKSRCLKQLKEIFTSKKFWRIGTEVVINKFNLKSLHVEIKLICVLKSKLYSIISHISSGNIIYYYFNRCIY